MPIGSTLLWVLVCILLVLVVVTEDEPDDFDDFCY